MVREELPSPALPVHSTDQHTPTPAAARDGKGGGNRMLLGKETLLWIKGEMEGWGKARGRAHKD